MEDNYQHMMLSEFIDELIKIKDKCGDCFMCGMVDGIMRNQINLVVEDNQDCFIRLK